MSEITQGRPPEEGDELHEQGVPQAVQYGSGLICVGTIFVDMYMHYFQCFKVKDSQISASLRTEVRGDFNIHGTKYF